MIFFSMSFAIYTHCLVMQRAQQNGNKTLKITGGEMRANPPEIVKNAKIKKNKQLISLIHKQNNFTFCDQTMLLCYLYENLMSTI